MTKYLKLNTFWRETSHDIHNKGWKKKMHQKVYKTPRTGGYTEA